MKARVLDMLERAGWTAAQAFFATWMVTDQSTVKSAVLAAVAAGLSVIKTFVAQEANARKA
jgi:hypothetical protein